MGSDLFGSFAESTCAALVVSSVSSLGTEHLWQVGPPVARASGLRILNKFLNFLFKSFWHPIRQLEKEQPQTLSWRALEINRRR
jgi:hypothetical protein